MKVETSTAKHRFNAFRERLTQISGNRTFLIGLSIVVAFVFMGAFANLIAPYPNDATGAVNFNAILQPPSLKHLFGTDDAGRDILSRLLFGTRISITAAFLVEGLVVAIGVPLGMIAAYKGGKTSTVIMRIGDAFMAVPPLLLAFVATTAFRPNLSTEIVAVSLAWWPWISRLAYSVVISVKNELFVDVGKVMGRGTLSIVFRDILPHTFPVIIVKFTLDMGFVILFVATLSFLGLGVQEPVPDWGGMISIGRQFLPTDWWYATFPGLFILFAVIGFNLMADGLRDLLDVESQEWIR